MTPLMNVDEALALILAQIPPLSSEVVPLSAALGRVLATDIFADINLPPFANSSMDGYALIAADSQNASPTNPVTLEIIEDIPAGSTPQKTITAGQAARIMTGAPLPDGANAVIPVEATNTVFDGSPLPAAVGIYQTVTSGANVRPIGENIAAGQLVVATGTVLRAAEIGILAMIGCSEVAVQRQPRVVIVGSGDELIDLGQPLSAGKIYDSNSYTLAALVQELGAIAIRLPIATDQLEAIRALFQNALAQQPDLIISSAGVSVGAADFTRAVLAELGEVGLWRINLRPGKPLAFGHLGNIPFFGLPGNPVSAMVTFEVLVRPALLKMMGKPDDSVYLNAILGESVQSDGRRSYLRVTLLRENGQWIVRTTGTQSSGALMSMVTADALMIITEDVTQVEAGTTVRVKLLKSLPQE